MSAGSSMSLPRRSDGAEGPAWDQVRWALSPKTRGAVEQLSGYQGLRCLAAFRRIDGEIPTMMAWLEREQYAAPWGKEWRAYVERWLFTVCGWEWQKLSEQTKRALPLPRFIEWCVTALAATLVRPGAGTKVAEDGSLRGYAELLASIRRRFFLDKVGGDEGEEKARLHEHPDDMLGHLAVQVLGNDAAWSDGKPPLDALHRLENPGWFEDKYVEKPPPLDGKDVPPEIEAPPDAAREERKRSRRRVDLYEPLAGRDGGEEDASRRVDLVEGHEPPPALLAQLRELRDLRDHLHDHRPLCEVADAALDLERPEQIDETLNSLRPLHDLLKRHHDRALQAALVYEWGRRGPKKQGAWGLQHLAEVYAIALHKIEHRQPLAITLLEERGFRQRGARR